MKCDGIILDMDGTITVPVVDFNELRKAAGIKQAGDLLKIIRDMPIAEQERILKVVERFELYAMENMELQDGFAEFYDYCREHKIRLGLLTRNRDRNVKALCDRYGLSFDVVLTRDFVPVKPAPEPALHILNQWNYRPDLCLFVGDYIHDINCGKNAGMKTCFMKNRGYEDFSEDSDFSISDFYDLIQILEG